MILKIAHKIDEVFIREMCTMSPFKVENSIVVMDCEGKIMEYTHVTVKGSSLTLDKCHK